jgi:plastocyanin
MKHAEIISRVLVVIGILMVLTVPLGVRLVRARNAIDIHARIAEAGGWSPSTLQGKVGEPLHLRLTSDDVMHGFAIGQSAMVAVDVVPGKVTDLTLRFDKPGTYTYYCTRWCGLNHWRMRGVIEVTGDGSSTPPTVSQPLYQTLKLDIDTPHPAPVTPVEIPSATRGAVLRTKLATRYLTPDYYRSRSPAQAYLDLRADPVFSSLNNPDVWDIIAYIWQINTPPSGLAEGQRLFAQNCAACHGESGGGNGVFAASSRAQTGKSPANFSDPVSMLGASPALLQGKILRGGMGTGMPYWGPIFTEQQIWNIIGYLYSLPFNESLK